MKSPSAVKNFINAATLKLLSVMILKYGWILLIQMLESNARKIEEYVQV